MSPLAEPVTAVAKVQAFIANRQFPDPSAAGAAKRVVTAKAGVTFPSINAPLALVTASAIEQSKRVSRLAPLDIDDLP